jgi:hypothetical protein
VEPGVRDARARQKELPERERVQGERRAGTHSFRARLRRGEGHHFFMTITLDARGNQTLVGWRQIFDTAAHRERIAKFV